MLGATPKASATTLFLRPLSTASIIANFSEVVYDFLMPRAFPTGVRSRPEVQYPGTFRIREKRVVALCDAEAAETDSLETLVAIPRDLELLRVVVVEVRAVAALLLVVVVMVVRGEVTLAVVVLEMITYRPGGRLAGRMDEVAEGFMLTSSGTVLVAKEVDVLQALVLNPTPVSFAPPSGPSKDMFDGVKLIAFAKFILSPRVNPKA